MGPPSKQCIGQRSPGKSTSGNLQRQGRLDSFESTPRPPSRREKDPFQEEVFSSVPGRRSDLRTLVQNQKNYLLFKGQKLVTPDFYQRCHPVHKERIKRVLPEVIYLKTTHSVGVQASPHVRKVYSRGLVYRYRWFREIFYSISSIPLRIQAVILSIIRGVHGALITPQNVSWTPEFLPSGPPPSHVWCGSCVGCDTVFCGRGIASAPEGSPRATRSPCRGRTGDLWLNPHSGNILM